MRIKKVIAPFPYKGSKRKYIDLIHGVIQEADGEGITAFYDPFAGSGVVSANVKFWKPSWRVEASFCDDLFEKVFLSGHPIEEAGEILEDFKRKAVATLGLPEGAKPNSRHIHAQRHENDDWQRLKVLYEQELGIAEVCPHCGAKKTAKAMQEYSYKQAVYRFFLAFMRSVLSSDALSRNGQKIQEYAKRLHAIDHITTGAFKGTGQRERTLFFLDPPYLQSVRRSVKTLDKNDYSRYTAIPFTQEDNKRIVASMEENTGRGNWFFIWTNRKSPLDERLQAFFEKYGLEEQGGQFSRGYRFYNLARRLNTAGVSYDTDEIAYLIKA